MDNHFEMPDKMVATAVRFLQQNNGVFSKRARANEFKTLTDAEVSELEKVFKEIFGVE